MTILPWFESMGEMADRQSVIIRCRLCRSAYALAYVAERVTEEPGRRCKVCGLWGQR